MLTGSACRDGPLGIFVDVCGGSVLSRTELRQGFVQLIGKFHELADGCDRAASTLRRLARDAGNDLHGMRDAFRAAHLLFGSERNFLHEFGGLANDAGNRIESATGLIGQSCAAFHFLGAFFHDDNRFVCLGLNGLDESCDVFRGAARVFGQLADFVGDDRETAASFTGASSFDGGIEREQVGLFGDVVDHVDDFRNFQRAIAEGLDLLGGRLHGSAYALHAFQGVADSAVALFGGVESAARGFGAGFGVVGYLFHRDRKFFDGAARCW